MHVFRVNMKSYECLKMEENHNNVVKKKWGNDQVLKKGLVRVWGVCGHVEHPLPLVRLLAYFGPKNNILRIPLILDDLDFYSGYCLTIFTLILSLKHSNTFKGLKVDVFAELKSKIFRVTCSKQNNPK